MLGWSINLFRLFGIQLAVHASFILLLVYSAIEGWSDGGGWLGMLVSVVLTIAFFICVVLHELGHSLTARRYGVRVPRILLTPIGGMAEFDHIPRQPSAELLITIAGPLVNFIIFGILAATLGLPVGFPFRPEFDDSLKGIGQLLLYWNAVMGCFNLLPVFPMDGGRIFRALLARRLPYLQATYWAAIVGKTLALVFAAVALFWFNRFMPAVLFGFIYLAADAEYRVLLRREQEAARWAEMARRVSQMPAAGGDQPPLIAHGPN